MEINNEFYCENLLPSPPYSIPVEKSLAFSCEMGGLYQWGFSPEKREFHLCEALSHLLECKAVISEVDLIERVVLPDQEIFRNSLKTLIKRGSMVSLTRFELHGYNRFFLINARSTPEGYIHGFFQNMSDTVESDYQKRLTIRLMENSFEAIVITDMNGSVESINPAFYALTGYDRLHFLQQNIYDYLEAFSDNSLPELQHILFEKGHWIGESCIRDKNGISVEIAVTISIVSDGNGHNKNLLFLLQESISSEETQKRYLYQSFHDTLTDLPNRQLMFDRLSLALEHSRRRLRHTALVLADIDGIRRINDSMGHMAGDELIRQVATRLQYCIRRSDTLARFGEDEFAFIVSDLKENEDVIKIVHEAQETFKKPFILNGADVFITACYGIALYPQDAEEGQTLIKYADSALNRAKREGPGNYRFFTKELNENIIQKIQLESRMRKALKKEEFVVFYQPKVDMKSGRSIGVEALIRWRDPQRGLISPGEFIPLAESSGLIIDLGEWVLRQACYEIGQYQQSSHPGLKLNVNLSAKQFRQKNLVSLLKQIIDKTGFNPRLLCLEITESIIMENSMEATRRMDEIRSLGIDLSLDDFGTGYSSLAYLSRFPISELKIDRSFITGIEEADENSTIASAIINMGHSLKLHVVAEGVETRPQLDFLLREKCDQIQGFYYSKPLPINELITVFTPYAEDQ